MTLTPNISTLLSLTALIAMLPAAILPFRRGLQRDSLMWLLLCLACLGPVLWSFSRFQGSWPVDLSATLWVSVSVTLLIFLAACLRLKELWRLTPLLLPYACLLGLIAVLSGGHGIAEGEIAEATGLWTGIHIAVSVLTYAFLTLSAVSALSVFIRERALKRKQQTLISQMLPSAYDAELLEFRFLTAAQIVLGVGIITGFIVQFYVNKTELTIDHKTLFSIVAFVMIGILLIARAKTGVRGRAASRYVLLAYLLLTLAYPGVKFVTDILIS